MLSPVRVAFEASSLGDGFTDSAARRGIYRVLKQLLIELSIIQDIELFITSLFPRSGIIDVIKVDLIVKDILSKDISLPSIYDLSPLVESSVVSFIHIERSILESIERIKNVNLKKGLRLLVRSAEITLNKVLQSDILLKKEIDVFHFTSPFKRMPTRNLLKKRVILTIYDMIPVLYPEYISRFGYIAFKRSIASLNPNDFIICISNKTKQDICDYLSFNPDNVFVTYLAADKVFQKIDSIELINKIKQKYGIGSCPYLLSVCTLEQRKNILFLIRAFRKLVYEMKSFECNLVLVGSFGSGIKPMLTQIADLGLASRIIFTGYVPDEDLAAIYSGSLAFVYPSLYEGFGLPPLEAMQCGTPVVTSNTSSLPEVVGDAGIMIDPMDEDALCQAILDIVDNESLRAKLASKGLQRSREFTWKKCAEQTVDVYRIASA